jgi:uncharacterized membrane protein
MTLASLPAARVEAQSDSYAPDALFMALFANGDALVEYDVEFSDPADEEVTVQLFGDTASDLIVTDFDDQLLVFDSNGQGQVTIAPAGSEGARISYVTPSLTSKSGNVWTFTLESPVDLAIRMPQDSVVTDFGDNLPTLTDVGNQTLLTFEAGTIQFSYVIGVVGTQEQAEITIGVAQRAMRDAKANYAGIVLADAEALMQSANAAMASSNFAEAERLASQATEQVAATIIEYGAADDAIANADAQISQANNQNRDTTRAVQLLSQANDEFDAGSYVDARTTAGQAVAAIGDAPQFPTAIVAVGAAVAGGAAGAYFFLFKRKGAPRPVLREQPNGNSASQEAVQEDPETAMEEPDAPEPPVPSVSASQLAGIPESQTDRELLARIVARIIGEKPGLRPEDRDVLNFLAEKEGAAFESEVRTKFSLPKTTVWRLVKRLESEELVEIRKAGGQNLIKLRFEGRQP